MGWLTAKAQSSALTCRQMLSPTVMEALEQLEVSSSAASYQNLLNFVDEQSPRRKRALLKILNRPALDFKNEMDVMHTATELAVYLYGSKNALDAWLILGDANEVVRFERIRETHHDFLIDGLTGFWLKNGGRAKQILWEQSYRSWFHRITRHRFFTHRIWSYLGIPVFLPSLTSDRFLFRSFDPANLTTGQAAYKTGRRLWTPVVASTLILYQLTTAYVQLKQEAGQVFATTTEQVRSARAEIKTLGQNHRDRSWIGYKLAVKEFFDKFQQEPRPDEDLELRKKFGVDPKESDIDHPHVDEKAINDFIREMGL